MRFARRLVVALACTFALATPAHADLLGRMFRQVGDQGGGGAPPPPQSDDLTAWAGEARSTNLVELLQVAIRAAPALQSATIDIAIAEARVYQTLSRDDWQIFGNGTLSRRSGSVQGNVLTDQLITFNGTLDVARQFPTGGTLTLHVGSQYQNFDGTQFVDAGGMTMAFPFSVVTWQNDASFTVAQPLLRGRGRAIYYANEARAALSRDATVLAKRLVAINTVQAVVLAYWDLVLAERQVAITRASLTLARERLRITQIGTDGGKVPRSELPAVQQIIATREEEVLNGELAVLDRSIALRRAAGMPIGRGELGLRVGGDLATQEKALELDKLIEAAFAASPELAQLGKQDKVATIDVQVTENGLLPQLDVSVTLGTLGVDNRIGTAWKNAAKFDDWFVLGGLTLQHSLGQESVKGLAREQRETRRKITVTAVDVKAQIAQAMSRAVAQLELAKRRVALSQRAIDLANQNIKIEEDRFNLGKATNFDVLNRQEELRQSELRKTQAIIDWHKAETVVQALTTEILPAYGISLEGTK
jgi:outer membrane protein